MFFSIHRHIQEQRHSLQVSKLCEAWYNASPFVQSVCDYALLIRAAALHDIGKSRIDTELLDLPRRLTTDEMAVIHKHPSYGYDIVVAHMECRDTARIIRQHHESTDGSGYPDGITDMRLEAVIIKICDMFDALTSDRPYRPAYPHEKALQIIAQDLRGEREQSMFGEFISTASAAPLAFGFTVMCASRRNRTVGQTGIA